MFEKKTFKAIVCQMCGNYSKTQSEIIKHHQKGHIFFFHSKLLIWDFKPLLEKAKPTSLDSSSDKPKAPIRNVGSQPLVSCMRDLYSTHMTSARGSFLSLNHPIATFNNRVFIRCYHIFLKEIFNFAPLNLPCT